jgi:hypothetical protein
MASAPAGPDPFDPAALRLSQGFAANIGVKKALLSVPVRKPDKSWFVRVHPDQNYRLQTAVIELKEDRGGETYLVERSLWPGLATDTRTRWWCPIRWSPGFSRLKPGLQPTGPPHRVRV